MKHYYAITWPAGQGTLWQKNDGKSSPFIRVYRFESKAARNEWVDAGQPYRSNPYYRESATLATIMPKIRWSIQANGEPEWTRGIDGPEELYF